MCNSGFESCVPQLSLLVLFSVSSLAAIDRGADVTRLKL